MAARTAARRRAALALVALAACLAPRRAAAGPLLKGLPALPKKEGIRLLNASQIDALVTKPVPEPVPRNQTAVEKKATLFREIVHLPDGGRPVPYFALNDEKAILVNTLCDQVLPVDVTRDELSPAGRAYVKQVQRKNGDSYNKTVGTSLSLQAKCAINATTGHVDCAFDLGTPPPQLSGLWNAAHPKAANVTVTGCSVIFDGSTFFSPDCFQGADPPDAAFSLSSAWPETAVRDIHADIHFVDGGLAPPRPVTLRYTHCQAAYNDWYPADYFGFVPLNQELVNDYRILGALPRLGEFGESGAIHEHGRDTPALKALLDHLTSGLAAKRNASLAAKGEDGYGGRRLLAAAAAGRRRRQAEGA